MPLNRTERSAAARARWLAELANAIESAQRLAWQLGTAERPSAEARQLYSRLEAARMEVEMMQGIDPLPAYCLDEAIRLDSLGWSERLMDPAD